MELRIAFVMLVLLTGGMLQTELAAKAVPTAFAQYTEPVEEMLAGVNVWDLDEERARLVRDARIQLVSIDVRFDEKFENAYALSIKYGFKILGNLNYETLNATPFTLDDWINTVRRAKDSYPAISIWEIWNEPTLAKYWLGYMDGTAVHYVDLLRSAYDALKSDNPSYLVLGLGGSQLNSEMDLPFAREVFSLGGAAYMDAISIHAYADDLNLKRTWDSYAEEWAYLLQQYSEFDKPIWLTETGLPSNQLTAGDQAVFLENSFKFFKAQGLAAYIFFQLIDYWETDTSVAPWGLLRTDLMVKASYLKYKDLLATSYNAPAPPTSALTVKSKTVDGMELTGVRVRGDKTHYLTPVSLNIMGSHTLVPERSHNRRPSLSL